MERFSNRIKQFQVAATRADNDPEHCLAAVMPLAARV